MTDVPHASRWVRAGAAVLCIAVVAVFLLSLRQYHHPRTGFTDLIGFGEQFESRQLPAVRKAPHYTHLNSSGYDGQFYAQMAVEPLLRDRQIDQALDWAPYRARRILFSWTAYALGLGRPEWILKAYALQNIVAWLLLAWLLLRWFPLSRTRNVLPWAGCLFGAGLMLSVRFALLEGPSVLVFVLAILAVERGRSWLGAVLMGFSGLGRETNLAASGILVERVPQTRVDALHLAGKLLVAALPFLLWVLYLRSLYHAFTYSNPDNFAFPFAGYFTKWMVTIDALRTSGWWGSYARFNLLALVGITTQAGFLLARREWSSPWWRMGTAYVALMPVLSFAVWGGDPGAATRVLLPMSFAFNVLIVRSRWFWPLAILGNLSALHGLHMLNVPWVAQLL